jgi:hypothetical protein
VVDVFLQAKRDGAAASEEAGNAVVRHLGVQVTGSGSAIPGYSRGCLQSIQSGPTSGQG